LGYGEKVEGTRQEVGRERGGAESRRLDMANNRGSKSAARQSKKKRVGIPSNGLLAARRSHGRRSYRIKAVGATRGQPQNVGSTGGGVKGESRGVGHGPAIE